MMQIPVTELVAIIWQRRSWLAKLTGIGVLLTIGLSFLIPNRYTSTAQLMPPDQQALTNASMLNALAGGPAFASSNLGGLMSARTPGSTSIGILSSRTAQDDIIDKFKLLDVYNCKLYMNARKKLTASSEFDEDKKTGLITISVTDKDKNRAHDMAAAYIEELDKLVNRSSTSSARRERVFLEQRLKSIKEDLDASSHELSQFSSQNATMDIQKQGQATMEAAGKVQGELITAESELSGLKAQYSDDNVRVREVRGRIEELQSQLRKMSGVGEDVDGATLKTDQLFPSVRKLPLLGFTYYDLTRKVTMEETIYETLTKQYELAKVQEAKEIPPIKVLVLNGLAIVRYKAFRENHVSGTKAARIGAAKEDGIAGHFGIDHQPVSSLGGLVPLGGIVGQMAIGPNKRRSEHIVAKPISEPMVALFAVEPMGKTRVKRH